MLLHSKRILKEMFIEIALHIVAERFVSLCLFAFFLIVFLVVRSCECFCRSKSQAFHQLRSAIAGELTQQDGGDILMNLRRGASTGPN